MASDDDEIDRKRLAFIAFLDEAGESLRAHGPAAVDDVRRPFEDLDRGLEEDERRGGPLGRSLPAR